MARQWTCRGCGKKWSRRKRICICGRKAPAVRKPTHLKVLETPYEEWVQQFGERCGICGRGPGSRRLDRDHCHRATEGRPRGLLCARCNRALPSWVTPEWLRAAADYLDRAAA